MIILSITGLQTSFMHQTQMKEDCPSSLKDIRIQEEEANQDQTELEEEGNPVLAVEDVSQEGELMQIQVQSPSTQIRKPTCCSLIKRNTRIR